MRKTQELTKLMKYYPIQHYQREGKQKQQTPLQITFENENSEKEDHRCRQRRRLIYYSQM